MIWYNKKDQIVRMKELEMGFRGATEELAFRGALMTFNARNRYEVAVRLDDELVARFPTTPVVGILGKLTQSVAYFQGKGMTIGDARKVTLQNGYLLMLEVTRDGCSLCLTYELFH